MVKHILSSATILFILLLPAQPAFSQENSILRELVNLTIKWRSQKLNDSHREDDLKKISQPVVFMDEIVHDKKHEYQAAGMKNVFHVKAAIKAVTGKPLIKSKGRDYSGNQPGKHFSGNEVSIIPTRTAHYQIVGRKGLQEFAFVPYSSTCNYDVMVYLGNKRLPIRRNGEVSICRFRANEKEIIHIYIMVKKSTYKYETFALWNYNEQK